MDSTEMNIPYKVGKKLRLFFTLSHSISYKTY